MPYSPSNEVDPMRDTTSRRATDIPRLRARPGVAIVLALGAIVVIGLLIGGLFFITNQQVRGGRDATSQEAAFRLAEGGLVTRLTQWQDWPRPAALGRSTDTLIQVGNRTGDTARVFVTMLTDSLFQVMSQASSGTSARTQTVRRVSQLVRLSAPIFNIRGALTVRGSTKIGGSTLINGNDAPPAGWACGSTQAAKPGIAIADSTRITQSGCSNYSCVQGDPKIVNDPVAGQADTYFKFGDFEWASMVGMADIIMTYDVAPAPAYTATGLCNRSVKSNWGDVTRTPAPAGPRPCESYFPIIYYPGNAKLTGGTGQGILLVEGDLEVQGLFQFYGPVIVRGRLRTSGTGGHFNGAVMAANVELEENSILGNAVVNYSSCAVESAIRERALPQPLPERSWTEMY